MNFNLKKSDLPVIYLRAFVCYKHTTIIIDKILFVIKQKIVKTRKTLSKKQKNQCMDITGKTIKTSKTFDSINFVPFRLMAL